MDLNELAEERRRVRELCRKHVSSLAAFKFPKGASFALFQHKKDDDTDYGRVRHLTTTATCIESLGDSHASCRPKGALVPFATSIGIPETELRKLEEDEGEKRVLDALKLAFYEGAHIRADWDSEDSARVYCASRALPLFLECTRDWTPKHDELITTIYEQLYDNPKRFGIPKRELAPSGTDPMLSLQTFSAAEQKSMFYPGPPFTALCKLGRGVAGGRQQEGGTRYPNSKVRVW